MMASLHEKHSAITAWCLFCSHFRVQKRKVQTKKLRERSLSWSLCWRNTWPLLLSPPSYWLSSFCFALAAWLFLRVIAVFFGKNWKEDLPWKILSEMVSSRYLTDWGIAGFQRHRSWKIAAAHERCISIWNLIEILKPVTILLSFVHITSPFDNNS